MYLWRIMLFAYLDEFGHQGPFVHRQDAHYKDSPVFGVAGIILPEGSIRPFATKFLQLKEKVFAEDIARAGCEAHHWEKKGSDIFRPKALDRYPALRQVGFRLLNTINNSGGKVFFYGREKIIGSTNVNPNGLYTTVLSHAIRQLDAYATSKRTNFALVVDEHSARKELLECAAKTMFGKNPTKHLVSPPFEVESYLNQNIQAADWVAAIVGRLWAYRVLPDQYKDHANLEKYFRSRIAAITSHSKVELRSSGRKKAPVAVNDAGPVPEAAVAKATAPKKTTVRYSVNDGKGQRGGK